MNVTFRGSVANESDTGAMLALATTTGGYVATTTNGGLNADQGACMGRSRCNEGEATGHRVRSWFTMLRWSLSIGIINY
jgi:hypothetical protein